jgi:hypothetical protein
MLGRYGTAGGAVQCGAVLYGKDLLAGWLRSCSCAARPCLCQ